MVALDDKHLDIGNRDAPLEQGGGHDAVAVAVFELFDQPFHFGDFRMGNLASDLEQGQETLDCCRSGDGRNKHQCRLAAFLPGQNISGHHQPGNRPGHTQALWHWQQVAVKPAVELEIAVGIGCRHHYAAAFYRLEKQAFKQLVARKRESVDFVDDHQIECLMVAIELVGRAYYELARNRFAMAPVNEGWQNIREIPFEPRPKFLDKLLAGSREADALIVVKGEFYHLIDNLGLAGPADRLDCGVAAVLVVFKDAMGKILLGGCQIKV